MYSKRQEFAQDKKRGKQRKMLVGSNKQYVGGGAVGNTLGRMQGRTEGRSWAEKGNFELCGWKLG